jgi:hypothetical protein
MASADSHGFNSLNISLQRKYRANDHIRAHYTVLLQFTADINYSLMQVIYRY